MVLIPCYECEKEISDKAAACVHCGAPKPTPRDHAELLGGYLRAPPSLALDPTTMEPYSGDFYHAQSLDGVTTGTYKNGKAHGLWVVYDTEARWGRMGRIRNKISYKNGEYHGPYESYHENGQLELKGSYHCGQQCGEWIEDGETVTYDPCPPDLADGN